MVFTPAPTTSTTQLIVTPATVKSVKPVWQYLGFKSVQDCAKQNGFKTLQENLQDCAKYFDYVPQSDI